VVATDVRTEGSSKFDYYHMHMLCDAIGIVVGDKWPSLLKRIEKKTTLLPIRHELLKHRSHAFLHDTAKFVQGVKLLEPKLFSELGRLKRTNPLKCKIGKTRGSTSISVNDIRMASNSDVSKKRAVESLLQLSSYKKAKCNKKRCAVNWCDCIDVNCSLIRVPVVPPLLNKKSPSIRQQITRQVKLFTRREYLNCLGLRRSYNGANAQFCSCHRLESKSFCIKMRVLVDGIAKDITETRVIAAPISHGRKHHMATISMCVSKGIARDRLATRILRQSNENLLAQQQTVEIHDIESGMYQLLEMNPCVRAAAGLDVHLKNDLRDDCDNKKLVTKITRKQPTMLRRNYTMEECTFTMDELMAEEVNGRTGFANIRDLLVFVAIVCNGDFERCTHQTSYLCWLEEWFFFFEMMYGRSGNRWLDFQRSYRISKSILRHIFKEKLQMVLTVRNIWPSYVTHGEDQLFRKQTWDDHFRRQNAETMPRLVMHDNTDIQLMCQLTHEFNELCIPNIVLGALQRVVLLSSLVDG